MITFGNWQKYLDSTLETERKREGIFDFCAIKDNESRIRYLQSRHLFESTSWIQEFFQKVINAVTNEKSVDLARKYRHEGNVYFQGKSDCKALECYNQAIHHAPEYYSTETYELGLAYGNRSAVFYHLREYKAALQDIELALLNHYPEHLAYKLHQRKGQCLQQLIRHREAVKAFQNALDNLDDNQMVDCMKKEKLRVEIKKVMEESQKSPDCKEKNANNLQDLPSPVHGYSDVLVQASTTVSLQYNTEKGRHLVANQDIKCGDVLIVEKPFAAVLLPSHYDSHCHHCFDRIKSFLPCTRCTAVRFCSVKCRNESWEMYHSIECPYLDLLHSIGIAHLSLRVILVAGLPLLLDFKEKLKARDMSGISGLTEAGKYERNYLSVYDLMPHEDDMDVEDIFQYSLTANLLLEVLRNSCFFKNQNPVPVNGNRKQTVIRDTRNDKSVRKFGETERVAEIQQSSSDDSRSDHYNKHSTLVVGDKPVDVSDNISKGIDDAICGVDTSTCVHGDNESCNSSQNKQGNNTTLASSHLITDQKNSVKLTPKSDTVLDSSSEHELTEDKQKTKIASPCMDSDVTESDVNSDVHYIGGLLLRHICQLVCNAHAITELQLDQTDDTSLVETQSQVRVATAIYPTASLMNHSCEPNILSSFQKDTLVVRAVNAITCDGEIFNCYGPHFRRMRRSERQRCLREQYFFSCTCSACNGDVDKQETFKALRCCACDGPLMSASSHSPAVATEAMVDPELKCRDCGKQSKVKDVLLKVNLAEHEFLEGLNLLQQGKYQESLAKLMKCHTIREIHLYKHNKDLAEVGDAIARCHAALEIANKNSKFRNRFLSYLFNDTKPLYIGDYEESCKFLRKAIVTTEVIYGSNSVELANELHKFAEVLCQCRCFQEALHVISRTEEILVQSYGDNHTSVEEVRKLKHCLQDLGM